jgi:hypothetical protein
MARESQGLQVLFIGSIMLSVALGVSLYLYAKEAGEATKAAVAEKLARQQVEGEMKTMGDECKALKTMIGLPDQSTDEIKKHFAEDMQNYSNGRTLDPETGKTGANEPLFDAGTLFYSRLLAGMYKTVQERTDELVQAKAGLADLQRTFKSREAAKDAQINAIAAGYRKLDDLVNKVTGDYRSGQQATTAEMEEIAKKAAEIKKNAFDTAAKAAEAEKAATQELQATNVILKGLIDKLPVDKSAMDVPSGEIAGVSQANKMVWINRGRADALPSETKFTVYSADSNNAAKAVKKGTIVVTRIDGDHSAQARILDDKIADPILVGDKIFTPLWSPGQRIHVALTGIMNLDGDARNQLNTVRGLINQNGGAVDCWLDEQGHKQGQITAETRYLVVGDAPERSSAEATRSHADILRDAERYPVHKLTLGEFKERMGYQKSSLVDHF